VKLDALKGGDFACLIALGKETPHEIKIEKTARRPDLLLEKTHL